MPEARGSEREVLERRRAAARRVVDPCSVGKGVPIDLEQMGMVKDVRFEDEQVVVELRLTHPICWQQGNIVEELERVTAEIADGVRTRVEIDHLAEWWPDMMAARARERLAARRPHALRDLPAPARPRVAR